LATWQAACSQDAGALNADPVFVTANTNPHLQVTSPCIGAGATSLVTDDYDGVARGAANDIGVSRDQTLTHLNHASHGSEHQRAFICCIAIFHLD
jgi:hypothetical protein